MQLMIAAAPPLRQMACGTQLPIANAAYRIENGVLCALPMPPALRGGAMLLTGAAGPFSPETAAGVVQECRRRRYGTVIVPFPAAELTEALAQPLHRSGIALWVHEKCAHTAPGARVLVCTALSGGDIENRLSACCRAFHWLSFSVFLETISSKFAISHNLLFPNLWRHPSTRQMRLRLSRRTP